MIAEIADPPIEAVALPGAGRAALERLMNARALQRIIALHAIVPRVAARASAQAPALDALLQLLLTLSADDAKQLFADARTGGAIARVLAAAGGSDAALARHLSVLPAQVPALAARLTRDWEVIVAAGASIPLNADQLARNVAPAELRVPLASLADEPSLARESRVRMTGLRIELFDARDIPELSERRLTEEHESDLPAVDVEAELERAFTVIREAWPAAMDDVCTFFRGLLAMKMPVERWNSASTGEFPGTLQLTLRHGGEPLLLAESILHESAHAKLDIAMASQPLLADDGVRRFRHPWRPDLRPITGVLLGAHAFLAVLLFYRRVARATGDPLATREVETREVEVGIALELLEREAAFTTAGRIVFAQMQQAYRSP